jgi:hypothetical protein
MFQKLLSFEYWKPGAPLLFDNRNFEFGVLNFDKMRAASNHYQQVSDRLGNGKVALLMKSQVDFAHGRQFEMLSEGKIEREMCVFRDEAEALKWLIGKEVF